MAVRESARPSTSPGVSETAVAAARTECFDRWVGSPQTHQAASVPSSTRHKLAASWPQGPAPTQLSLGPVVRQLSPGRCSPLVKVPPSNSPHPMKIRAVASKQRPASVQPTLSPTLRVLPEVPKAQERPASTGLRAKGREALLPVPLEKQDQNRPLVDFFTFIQDVQHPRPAGRKEAHLHAPDFLRCRRSERSARGRGLTARAPRVADV